MKAAREEVGALFLPFAVDFPHSRNWECSRTACSRAGSSVSDTHSGEDGSSPPLRPLPRLPHLTLLSGRPLMDAAAARAENGPPGCCGTADNGHRNEETLSTFQAAGSLGGGEIRPPPVHHQPPHHPPTPPRARHHMLTPPYSGTDCRHPWGRWRRSASGEVCAGGIRRRRTTCSPARPRR